MSNLKYDFSNVVSHINKLKMAWFILNNVILKLWIDGWNKSKDQFYFNSKFREKVLHQLLKCVRDLGKMCKIQLQFWHSELNEKDKQRNLPCIPLHDLHVQGKHKSPQKANPLTYTQLGHFRARFIFNHAIFHVLFLNVLL